MPQMTRVPMSERRIDGFMSPLPLSIATDVDTHLAARTMRDNGVGHLLVKDGDRLVGLLSASELELLTRLGGRWTCGAVVATDPLEVDCSTPLAEVVGKMLATRASAAVVASRGQVVGIVTTSDLLRALEGALGVPGRVHTPEEVRHRILAEHVRIRSLLDDIETLADAVVRGADEQGGKLRQWVRMLGDAMHAHLALEEEIMVPLVRESDGFGDARADEMLREHVEQRDMIRTILEEIAGTRSNQVVAVSVLELVKAIRDDIGDEDETFLSSDVLRNSVVERDA